MNLAGLETRTTVEFDNSLKSDQLKLNGELIVGDAAERVTQFLNQVRKIMGKNTFAAVESNNNFPTGAGIASSASAFAALAIAASKAADLDLDLEDLSRLARTGSGSASRSVPGGFVEWFPGKDHKTSFSASIAPPEHWNLVDCIAIVNAEHKRTGSSQGHLSAATSILQKDRVANAPQRLEICRRAVLAKDFSSFAQVVELDCNLMHAVMMTSEPPLMYWQPATLAVMQAVKIWRSEGIEACYTIDAGPNVHVLCTEHYRQTVQQRLDKLSGINQVLIAGTGGGARLID